MSVLGSHTIKPSPPSLHLTRCTEATSVHVAAVKPRFIHRTASDFSCVFPLLHCFPTFVEPLHTFYIRKMLHRTTRPSVWYSSRPWHLDKQRQIICRNFFTTAKRNWIIFHNSWSYFPSHRIVVDLTQIITLMNSTFLTMTKKKKNINRKLL